MTSGKKTILTITIIAVVAALAGIFVSLKMGHGRLDTESLSATVFTQPRPIAPFNLVNDDDRAFVNASLQGHWSLLFFGFTNCGYICPTTLAQLNQLEKKLRGIEGEATPTVVFVSIDPERDDVPAIKRYVQSFNPHFIGVTGEPKAIADFADTFKIAYAKVMKEKNGAQENYDVDHSAAIIIVDPKGQFYGLFTPPLNVDQMAKDLLAIQKHSG